MVVSWGERSTLPQVQIVVRGTPLPGLRAARLAKLLTQQELADLAGVSLNTINRLEREGTPAELRTVKKLADALEVQPAALLSARSGRK